MTNLDKSDIVKKISSLHLQESITMPEEAESAKEAAPARETMPTDDPVGAALRRLHDEVIAEPIPDEFLKLLGEIEAKIEGASGTE